MFTVYENGNNGIFDRLKKYGYILKNVKIGLFYFFLALFFFLKKVNPIFLFDLKKNAISIRSMKITFRPRLLKNL